MTILETVDDGDCLTDPCTGYGGLQFLPGNELRMHRMEDVV